MVMKRCMVLMVLVSFGLALPCLAQQRDAKVNADVKALVEQHNKGFSAHDSKGVFLRKKGDSL